MPATRETEEILIGLRRVEITYAIRSMPCTARCEGCNAPVSAYHTEFETLDVVELPDRNPYSGADREELSRLVRANVMIRGGALGAPAFLCRQCSGDDR